MKSFTSALQSVAVTLWVGGLWAIGLLAAPLLFHTLGDRSEAGRVAGQLFTALSYVGWGCGAYLLLFRLARDGGQAFGQLLFWVVLVMLALAAAGQFGVQPILAGLREQALPTEVMHSLLRNRFAAWHGVASGLYVIECLFGVALVVQHGRGR